MAHLSLSGHFLDKANKLLLVPCTLTLQTQPLSRECWRHFTLLFLQDGREWCPSKGLVGKSYQDMRRSGDDQVLGHKMGETGAKVSFPSFVNKCSLFSESPRWVCNSQRWECTCKSNTKKKKEKNTKLDCKSFLFESMDIFEYLSYSISTNI